MMTPPPSVKAAEIQRSEALFTNQKGGADVHIFYTPEHKHLLATRPELHLIVVTATPDTC